MAKVKTWHADFTGTWSSKLCGSKPSADLLECAVTLGALVRKRPGFEVFCATMALRDTGVTMPQYKNATGAASAAINTVGNNDRNPFLRAKLCSVLQSRNDAGDTVYAMQLTAKGVLAIKAALPHNKLDGVAHYTATPVKPAAKPVKPVKAEPAAVEPKVS
jgi:hypothetical protein